MALSEDGSACGDRTRVLALRGLLFPSERDSCYMTVTTFSAECAAASLPHAGLPARPARDILLAEMADPAFEEVIGNRATPAGLKAFRERHEAWSDARIDERIGDGRLINEERQILFDILAQ